MLCVYLAWDRCEVGCPEEIGTEPLFTAWDSGRRAGKFGERPIGQNVCELSSIDSHYDLNNARDDDDDGDDDDQDDDDVDANMEN